MTPEPTWPAVRQRIVGLWPKFEPTDAEASLIASRLSGLRMRWLDEAVSNYRCECTSTVFRLAELLEHYRRIANTGIEVETKAKVVDHAKRRAEELEAIERDAAQARRWLGTQPRAEVAMAVQRLRQMGWIKPAPLPARFEDWAGNTAMMVMARMQIDTEERHAGAGGNDAG